MNESLSSDAQIIVRADAGQTDTRQNRSRAGYQRDIGCAKKSEPESKNLKGMEVTQNLKAVIIMAGVAVGLTLSSAQAESPVKLGKLTCMVGEVDKKLLKTHIVLDCTYVDVNGNNVSSLI